jgi:hypothetical protein
LNGIHISRPVECPLKMTKVQGDQPPVKRQKMLKKFKNSSTKTIAEQSMRCRHSWDQLRSLPGDINRKFEHEPHYSITTLLPTRPWKPQSLWLNQHGYHSPSSLLAGLSSLWLRFVFHIEDETEGTFWNSVWHPKGIASGTRQHSTVLLRRGKTTGSLYTFQGDYFEGSQNLVKPAFLFWPSPGTFRWDLVLSKIVISKRPRSAILYNSGSLWKKYSYTVAEYDVDNSNDFAL